MNESTKTLELRIEEVHQFGLEPGLWRTFKVHRNNAESVGHLLRVNSYKLNETDASSELTPGAKAVLFVIYALIFFIGVTANTVILYYLGWKPIQMKRKIRNGHGFIIALACTDLTACMVMPFTMLNDLAFNFKWHYGAVFCHIIPSVNPVLMLISAWLLVAISYERIRSFLQPFKEPVKKVHMHLLICIIVTIGIIIVSPHGYYHVVSNGQCWAVWPERELRFFFYMTFATLGSLVPFLAVTMLYTILFICLKRGTARISNAVPKERIQEDKRIIRMIFCLVCVFFILISPYAVFLLIYSYLLSYDPSFYRNHEELFVSLNYAIFTLSATNSAINPFIYGHKTFRNIHTRLKARLQDSWRYNKYNRRTGGKRGSASSERRLLSTNDFPPIMQSDILQPAIKQPDMLLPGQQHQELITLDIVRTSSVGARFKRTITKCCCHDPDIVKTGARIDADYASTRDKQTDTNKQLVMAMHPCCEHHEHLDVLLKKNETCNRNDDHMLTIAEVYSKIDIKDTSSVK